MVGELLIVASEAIESYRSVWNSVDSYMIVPKVWSMSVSVLERKTSWYKKARLRFKNCRLRMHVFRRDLRDR